jgi:type I restriction-modification system DNA methylase subunit
VPTDHVKEIVKLLEGHRYQHDIYTVFSDNVAAMAYSISNAVDLRQRDKREQRYMDIVGRYDKATINEFPKMLAHVTLALEERPQDVLGSVFHELELQNKARGQFFTPYDVSKLMAHMQVTDDLEALVQQKGFVTLHEPAVGSGSMVIAMAEAMQERGMNPQQQLHLTAVDVDERAAHMAYVQLSLLGIPAEVLVGNTLSGEMRESFFTPAHILGGWSGRLTTARAMDDARDLVVGAQSTPSVEQQLVEPTLDQAWDEGRLF